MVSLFLRRLGWPEAVGCAPRSQVASRRPLSFGSPGRCLAPCPATARPSEFGGQHLGGLLGPSPSSGTGGPGPGKGLLLPPPPLASQRGRAWVRQDLTYRLTGTSCCGRGCALPGPGHGPDLCIVCHASRTCSALLRGSEGDRLTLVKALQRDLAALVERSWKVR